MRWLLFYFLGVTKHIQTRISSCENSKPSVINWKYLTNFNNSMECLRNIGLLNRILITRGPWLSQIISISDFTLPWLYITMDDRFSSYITFAAIIKTKGLKGAMAMMSGSLVSLSKALFDFIEYIILVMKQLIKP